MRTLLKVFCLYILVAFLITYPLVFNLNIVIPYFPDWLPQWLPGAKDWAPAFGDSHFFPWFLWWLKKALFDLHQNPLTTGYLFAPQGVFLGSSLENLVNIIFSLPLQLFLGPVAAYNLLIIFNFVLAGTAVFYFVNYFVKSQIAAFLAGLYFMTSSFMVLRSLGHFNIQTTAYLIFFLLFFIRIFELKKIREGIFAAGFLFLTALSSWYYFFYGAIMAAVIALYFFRSYSNSLLRLDQKIPFEAVRPRTSLRRLADRRVGRLICVSNVNIFLLITTVLLLPFILLLYMSNRAGVLHGHSIASSVVYSADLLSYFLPHRLGFFYHPIGGWFDRLIGLWSSGGNTMEKTAFLGLSGLAAVAFYLLKLKDDPRRGLWLGLLGVTFILSLGPLLTVGGRILPIPLPYGLLYYYFPFFVFLRDPNRFSVFVFLLTALFLGYFVRSIYSRNLPFEASRPACAGRRRTSLRRLTDRRVIVIVIALLIMADNLIWPYPLITVGDNPFYQSLKAEKTDYTVLNLPLREDKAANHPYLFAQIFHEKKMINGAVQPVGYRDSLFAPIRSYPLSLLNCDYQKTAKEAVDPNRWLGDLKNYLLGQNVRYLIWHKDLPDVVALCPAVVSYQRLVNGGNDFRRVYEDKEISAFAVN